MYGACDSHCVCAESKSECAEATLLVSAFSPLFACLSTFSCARSTSRASAAKLFWAVVICIISRLLEEKLRRGRSTSISTLLASVECISASVSAEPVIVAHAIEKTLSPSAHRRPDKPRSNLPKIVAVYRVSGELSQASRILLFQPSSFLASPSIPAPSAMY